MDMSSHGRGVVFLGQIVLVSGFALSGCASSTKEPASTESAPAAPAAPAQDPAEESAAPSKQKLAEAAAAQVAATWDAQKAAKEKVELTLRVRVDDMSAVVVGKGDGATTLTGIDAVNTKPDVVIDLLPLDAQTLAEGGTTLRQLKEAGKTKTDNDQGLDFFLSYTK